MHSRTLGTGQSNPNSPRMLNAPLHGGGIFQGVYQALNVEIYTREGCHLCHDAENLLKSFGLQPVAVDIDQRPDLLSRYTNCVPVVVMDGKVRFRGRIDPLLLKRLLK